jgi:hypothetical protein
MPSARRATSPADLAPVVFSTAGLTAARRVERWEAHNATALIGLDVHAPGPLDATEINVQLPRARLARVTASAHAVERTNDVIARCPADSIAVYLALRGDAWFTSAGGTYRLRPGDAIVCATDQPFARRFAGGLEELVVTVPCSALSDHCDARLGRPMISLFSTAGSASRPGSGATLAAATEVNQYARALARRGARDRAPRCRAVLYRGAPDQPGARGGAGIRRDRHQRTTAFPRLRRRWHVPAPAHPDPTPARRILPSVVRAVGPADSGRHRRPVRLHVSHLLLPRVPPAFRPPRERPPPRGGRVTSHFRHPVA